MCTFPYNFYFYFLFLGSPLAFEDPKAERDSTLTFEIAH
jgi:hypothetical protein